MAGTGGGTEVAHAYVTLLPKLGAGFQNTGQKAAQDFGQKFSSGITTVGVTVANLLANTIQSAIGNIGQLLGDSIQYSDALTRFPLVLQSLGIAGDEAAISIQKLREGLEGTPILVSDATTAVQRLVATTGDVEKSTAWFIALNDAVMAGGAPFQVQQAAIEQWQQAVAKGKPDRIEFRSFMQAFPGVMKQVAMKLGVTTSELQKMFSDNKITMQEFNDVLLDLDKNGVEGFSNLKEQARKALVGIDTGFGLVRKSIIETFGTLFQDLNISSQIGVFQDIGKMLGNALKNTLTPLNDWIKVWLQKAIERASDPSVAAKFEKVSIIIGTKLGVAFGWAGLAVDKFNQHIKSALPEIAKFAGYLADEWLPVLADIAPVLGDFFSGFIKGATAAGRIVSSLTKFVVELAAKLGELPIIGGIFRSFADGTHSVAEALGVLIGEFAALKAGIAIFKMFAGTGKYLAQPFKTLLEWSKKGSDKFKQAMERIKGAAETSLKPLATNTSKAGKPLKDLGEQATKAGNATKKAAPSFSQLAGQALKIVAIGGSMALAGVGLKLIADGATEVGQAGIPAVVALGLMGAAIIGFTTIISILGNKLVTTAPQLIALGGALTLAGAGMLALGAGAALVGSQGMPGIIALGIMSATLVVLVPLFALLGDKLAVAIPGMLAFGGAVLMAGTGLGIAAAGVGVLAFGIADLVRALGEFVDKAGIANQMNKEVADGWTVLYETSAKIMTAFGDVAEAIGGIAKGIGKAIEGVGYAVLAWGLNQVGDALGNVNNNAWGAIDGLNGIAGASDNAGGALGNLAGTAQSVCATIQASFDGLSNAIYGVSQQIIGSITNAFYTAKDNALAALNELQAKASDILNNINTTANQTAQVAQQARQTYSVIRPDEKRINKMQVQRVGMPIFSNIRESRKEDEKPPIVLNFYDTQTSPDAIYQKFVQSNTYGLAVN